MEIKPISSTGGAGYPPVAASGGSKLPVAPIEVGGAAPADAVKAVPVAPKPEELRESVSKINKTLQSLARDLEFSVDEDTRMNIVKVVDTKTKDVIRQFPSEDVVAIAKALDKLQGLLFKEKA